jgi:hypothetical protein
VVTGLSSPEPTPSNARNNIVLSTIDPIAFYEAMPGLYGA